MKFNHSIKVIIFLLVCHLSVFTAKSQETKILITDSSVALKKGFYRTYEEFKYNSPSLDLPVNVISNNEFISLFSDPFESYKLEIADSLKNILEKGTPIWGYCDGNSIFINREDAFRKRVKYDKLIFLNEYCYFETTGYSGGGGMMVPMAGGGMMMSGGGSSKVIVTMFFDFNTGEVKNLTKREIKSLLAKYPDLLSKFKEETWKYKVLKKYLEHYCARLAAEKASANN